jgi:hypothetical protein
LLRFFIGAAYLFFGFTHSNQRATNPAAQGKYQEKQEGFKSKILKSSMQGLLKSKILNALDCFPLGNHGKQSSALLFNSSI